LHRFTVKFTAAAVSGEARSGGMSSTRGVDAGRGSPGALTRTATTPESHTATQPPTFFSRRVSSSAGRPLNWRSGLWLLHMRWLTWCVGFVCLGGGALWFCVLCCVVCSGQNGARQQAQKQSHAPHSSCFLQRQHPASPPCTG
jgi:hypothetical protein